jgi:uncharacterized membrane protein YecN with MAPEG domain
VKVLQNTIEQFVISFVLQLATSTWLEPLQMAVIPIVVILFVVGRSLFLYGYLDPSLNRTNRALGFTPTVCPNGLMLLYCIYKLVASTVSIN